MMNLELLFSKSKELEDKAPADVYPMFMEWIRCHKNTSEEIRGFAALLFIWNIGYYGRAKRGYFAAVRSLQNLFKDSAFKEARLRIERTDIVAIDLQSMRDTIISVYSHVDSREGFGIAASGKILHLLQPDMFVVWDDEISKKLHKEHRKQGLRHERGGAVCYYEFLVEMQSKVKLLVHKMEKEEIEKKLTNIAGYPKTLAKGLDEFNYMTITALLRKRQRS